MGKTLQCVMILFCCLTQLSAVSQSVGIWRAEYIYFALVLGSILSKMRIQSLIQDIIYTSGVLIKLKEKKYPHKISFKKLNLLVSRFSIASRHNYETKQNQIIYPRRYGDAVITTASNILQIFIIKILYLKSHQKS